MRRYRSVVALILAAIATFIVSCGPNTAAEPPTYTPEKVTQLRNYTRRLLTAQDRLPELAGYINKEDWVNVNNFTHGPLGDLREQMARLTNQLLPQDQDKAKVLSKEVLGHLQKIDDASDARSYERAAEQYSEFRSDLQVLLDLLPVGAVPQISEPEASVYEMSTPVIEPNNPRPEAEDMVTTPILLDDGPKNKASQPVKLPSDAD
ncbi:photosystem II protein PsbQ [Romeria aff. gracilis LEGE 07310]|uniref:Photosystem II protein PsbQ n=1 Tax=Vasconcelosia minhoensis LEGE 07310 TaxID=915328 RepID=A0A8J7DQV9_9CYAN|nr:photosystem II protein PsbQ [Romeria gracilis]MBE9077224.1 photosystem II protein PsbQ [Romeria aff. gracilis LEGE 07310]